MKLFSHLHIYGILLSTALLFTSCYSEDALNSRGGDAVTISLNFRPDGMDGGTRANGSMPSSSTANSGELKINHVCVGVFDGNTNLITLKDFDYSGSAQTMTTSTSAKYIVAAVNIPAEKFSKVTTKTDFYAITQNLDYTSYDGTSTKASTLNSQQQTMLPMIGEYSITSALTTTGTTTIPIDLTRLVSRVMLTSITTSFISPLAGATFVPKEIFMYNVADVTDFTGKVTENNRSGESTSATVAGDPSTLANAPTLGNYAYLSSGLISTASYPYYFYVHPHSDTAPTKLVVKGVFYPKGGSEATGEVMYYPIIVNHYQTGVTINGSAAAPTNDSKITKNTIYSLSLTIKGRGTASPSDDISPASASVNVSVASWDALSKNASEYDPPITLSAATWGTGGGAIPFLPHPNVGEYLFADGTWGTLAANSGKTPIAVIFSTNPTTTDKANGFVHGYALALQNANSSNTMTWSSSDTKILANAAISTTYTAIKTDKDGYTKTMNIYNNYASSNLENLKNTFYAAYWALKFKDTVTPPVGTSGWYLPSIGDWYDFCVNLGGLPDDVSQMTNNYDGGYYWNPNYNVNYRANTISAIWNTYLNNAATYGATVSSFNISMRYWASSQYDVSNAFYMSDEYDASGTSGAICLYIGTSLCCVRPMIAF
ncbi:hypothetical protein prwr041_03310 [Prevotella herbatica]|uniref:Major fimbrium subunit FimA C-terminal domain-containing protein n=1 Tax=Prevotella herbatica TaxID=2801997 RepID=A0ABM7NVE2_9BACT|nr:hypothetical protein [Prevotella herbatica]BCS84438.1 hypothetical protein prwr041_03310 [Prevotella herbatica]